MGRIEFEITEKMQETAIKKCEEIIEDLSPLDIKLQAFILFTLITSFKDISGIDISDWIKAEVEDSYVSAEEDEDV